MRVLIKNTFCYIHTTVNSVKARGPHVAVVKDEDK